MSSVILNVGQCGNQMGKTFLKTVLANEQMQKSHIYMEQGGQARSVHVDSESKVIGQIRKLLPIRERNMIHGKRGRGSNWALGYNGLKSGLEDHLVSDTLEALRKEIEGCDSYHGIIMMHSLTGGTGSGLGSKLCEMIRDDYPMNYILSCTFAPFSTGESPLQHYNSLLTLSTLQSNTDGIILTYNDEILYRLQKTRGDKSVSLDHINQATSNNLCGIFLPTDSLTPKRGLNIGREPWELLGSICPMPSTKFIHINHLAKSKLTWDGLVGQTLQNLTKHNKHGKPFSCLAGVVVGRGDQSGSFHHSMEKSLNNKIKTGYNCVNWNPFPLDIWSAKTNKLGGRECSSVTVAANYSNIVEYLERVCSKAKLMYENKAYLHWYWRYGATQEVFTEAFHTVDQIIEDYKSAVK